MPALCAASSALFERRVLLEEGLNASMIASRNPPSAAAWMYSARRGWWEEKPTNFALPDFLIASTALPNSALL